MAKRRLQSRQRFWRSGVSTMAELQHAPTGHTRQTVAQERRLARSVGVSRRSPRVWRDQLQALTSAWSRTSAYATLVRSPNLKKAVDAVAPMDAQNASTAAWKSRPEREIHTATTAPPFFFGREERRTPTTTIVQIYAVSDERRHLPLRSVAPRRVGTAWRSACGARRCATILFIGYSDGLKVNNSLLTVVFHD